jgi:large subunit ribosomal protein L30
MAELQVTQVRSAIGSKPKHRATLRALGLRRVGRTVTLPDRPEIRGMIARVPHLVRVEVSPEGGPSVEVSPEGGPNVEVSPEGGPNVEEVGE